MTTSSLSNPCKIPVFLLSPQNQSNKFNFKTQKLVQTHNKIKSLLIYNPNFNKLPRISRPSKIKAAIAMEGATDQSGKTESMKNLLFVEMGVGYDQHGQDITAAAMRACRDAISSNSIPAFRRGSIPGVSFEQMKLQIKLGVPRSLQQSLDIEKWKNTRC
ncbi:uncharacterized protein LOC104900570 isoform X2 [Beta vulgaris subsp. vulgaris]|uniref:uncharacterized protein LOC104900570 isoform X2 n=1 Tax=Beta vulgaris subsp. vulgaris TaxID=3555 RepID=UPI002547CD92|nr:uncharacterized protein LOC104900570 isoform X2 [Beta vulgaris subsp. vulgaris]